MSNHNEGDFGQTELDPQERADADVNLDDPTSSADEPWSPPDRQPRGAEMAEVEDETLSMRLRQEESEPSDEVEAMLGGDDPDAIPADEDVLGGDADSDAVDATDGLDAEPGPEAGAMHLE